MNYDLGYLPHCEGAWNNYTAYDPMAIVTNYGVAYISKVAVSAGAYEPGQAAGWGNYWQILAEGVQGTTGNRGPQGAAGTNGINGVDGVDGAQGTQGPAGTSPSIPAIYWRIKNVTQRANVGALEVDKMGGGESHVYTGVTSLKLTNVQVGNGTTLGRSGGGGTHKANEGWIPSYMFIGVKTDFILHKNDMLDPNGLPAFIFCNQPEGKFLGGHNYLLTFFEDYVVVEEMYALP